MRVGYWKWLKDGLRGINWKSLKGPVIAISYIVFGVLVLGCCVNFLPNIIGYFAIPIIIVVFFLFCTFLIYLMEEYE